MADKIRLVDFEPDLPHYISYAMSFESHSPRERHYIVMAMAAGLPVISSQSSGGLAWTGEKTERL